MSTWTKICQMPVSKVSNHWKSLKYTNISKNTFQFMLTDLFYINFIYSNNDHTSVFLKWQFLWLSFISPSFWFLTYSSIEQNKIITIFQPKHYQENNTKKTLSFLKQVSWHKMTEKKAYFTIPHSSLFT